MARSDVPVDPVRTRRRRGATTCAAMLIAAGALVGLMVAGAPLFSILLLGLLLICPLLLWVPFRYEQRSKDDGPGWRDD